MHMASSSPEPLDYATPVAPARRNWPAPLGLVCGMLVAVTYAVRPESYRWFRVRNADVIRLGVIAALAIVGALALGATGIWIANRSAGRHWRRAAIAALCLGAANVPLFIGLVQYQTQKAADDYGYSHSFTRCGSNLRQVGMYVIMYAIEHGDRLPDSLEDLIVNSPLPREYDRIAECMVCPLSNDVPAQGNTAAKVAEQLESGGHVSYVYVGKGLTRATATPRHVIAYEREGNHPQRRGSPLWVLFGDMRVDRVTPAELRKLVKELQSGHNPARPEMLQ